jgi:D-lactate dehydrogenase (cytochrome)
MLRYSPGLPLRSVFLASRNLSKCPCSSRLLLHRDAHSVSTSNSPENSQRNPGFIPVGPFWLLALIASGGLGYAIARYTEEPPVPKAAEPKFGTPEDFSRAIGELKGTLGKDRVSTDPEDLFIHGFSANDYHPGMVHI